ncbi:GTPase Era [Striga asiatica]|uniref:GTPase Era n=1 Tax=Striga asiatica TaxID=4170 RepID=A0A5A7Q6A7_STRAF|nr:GTPase Era [Striga asiatica]
MAATAARSHHLEWFKDMPIIERLRERSYDETGADHNSHHEIGDNCSHNHHAALDHCYGQQEVEHCVRVVEKTRFTFISSINDGKPPMVMNVMKPDMKPPQAPLARIAWELVPTSWKTALTHKETKMKTMILSQ